MRCAKSSGALTSCAVSRSSSPHQFDVEKLKEHHRLVREQLKPPPGRQESLKTVMTKGSAKWEM